MNYKNLTVTDVEVFLEIYSLETIGLNDYLAELENETLSWETFIAPQLALDVKFASQMQILNMDDFHPNEEIRKVCNDISTEFQKFSIEQGMRRDVFLKFKYYYENQYKSEKDSLSSERQKFIEDHWKAYLMNGLNLEDEQFEKVKEIKKELAEISSKFSFNLTNANASFEFTLDQLLGLPESWLTSRLQENGNYKVSLKYPDYLPLMEHCKVRETRKIMSTAFNTRCGVENAPLVQRAFRLRHKLAEIFGFDSFANYSLQNKMAKNYDNVMNFLNNLRVSLEPVLENDYNELYKFANLDGVSQLEIYDMAYYMRLYKESKTSLDNESLRQYFKLSDVTAGIFTIYQQFLSVKFTEVTENHLDELWHESVQLFQVNDEKSGEIMGHFYLDLYPRNGKYGHAAVFPFVRKSSSTLPICAMACNFVKDGGLNHSEVVTYFHEFGHVMHNICSDVELICHGGTATTRDYVECPSQLFENWCFTTQALNILSANTLPEEVVIKLNQQEKLCQGYHYSRQLLFGFSDMLLHSSKWNEDPDDVYNQVMRDVLKLEPLENMKFIESFSHILCGYEAGYYGYLWSEVFSADLYYTCIKGRELDSEIGLKIRKEILSYGGSREDMEGLVAMLGREPNNEGFIKSIFG